MNLCLKVVFALVVFDSLFVKEAYAYLDPGTGSYFLQLMIGLLLGCAYAIKMYWQKIKMFFITLFSRKKKDAGK